MQVELVLYYVDNTCIPFCTYIHMSVETNPKILTQITKENIIEKLQN